jgi:hypothetical protein
MNPDPDDLERRLREALHRDAERIRPRERRTEILAMTQLEKENVNPPRRWLIPAAAAAAVAVIGVGTWGLSNTGGRQLATPAVTSTSTATGGPTTSPTAPQAAATAPAPLPSATGTGGAAGATTQVTLPVYFVGATSTTGNGFSLYREFVRTAVPAGGHSAPAGKIGYAVSAAMNSGPLASVEPYLQPWAGTSLRGSGVNNIKGTSVAPTLITLTLSGPGASGFTPAQTRLAVQQLVWTAQAALGQGNTPVKFDIASGQTKLFGTYPTSQTYNRPPPSLQYEVLAPIWITSPVRGQVFPAGAPVVAAGQSCAFEGTTQWQLKKSGTTVRSGSTTASSGCPTRGTWQVKLGVLGAGSYSFRMYEVSMQDGTVIADTSKPFTVR